MRLGSWLFPGLRSWSLRPCQTARFPDPKPRKTRTDDFEAETVSRSRAHQPTDSLTPETENCTSKFPASRLYYLYQDMAGIRLSGSESFQRKHAGRSLTAPQMLTGRSNDQATLGIATIPGMELAARSCRWHLSLFTTRPLRSLTGPVRGPP